MELNNLRLLLQRRTDHGSKCKSEYNVVHLVYEPELIQLLRIEGRLILLMTNDMLY